MTSIKHRTAALLLAALMAATGVFAVSAATADNARAAFIDHDITFDPTS